MVVNKSRFRWPRRRTIVRVACIAVVLALLPLPGAAKAAAAAHPWDDTSLPPAERARLVLAAMTLEEKVELMTGDQGAAPAAFYNAPIPRLGIPELRMADAGSGIAPRGWTLPGTGGRATAMPAGIALAAAWDPSLVRTYARVVTDEAKATRHNVLLGPNADIVRLPWWGRIAETESEDPLLTSRIAAPYVAQVQAQHVIADLKHYNAYNQETNRGNAQNSILDERALQEIYTRPWQYPVRAGLGSVMCSFNKINDIFSCENADTLGGVLRQQIGFTGFVITDFGAIHSTVPSLVAGTDLETGTANFYDGPLLAAVRGGQVPEAYLDRSVLRILTTMFRLGLFDNTYGPGTIPVRRHGAVARTVEEQAVTLLKNAGNALPLARDVKSIAVIGGDANIAAALGGASRVEPTYTVSLLQGIQARAGSGVTVRYAPGSDPVNAAAMLPGPQAVPSSVLATPDGERGLRAEWFTNTMFAGAPAVVRTERQVNPDWGFLSTFAGLNPSQVPPPPASGPTASGSVRYAGTLAAPATGTYTFSLTGWGDAQMYLNGDLVVDMTGQNGVRSVTSAPMRLIAGQPNELRITFAGTRPRTGLEPATLQLGWTHPANAIAPQVREAAAVARGSDVAIVLARLHEGEQRDRASLTLPNEQDLLIRQVRQANPKTIVVLATGGPITMPWLSRVPAVVQAYYGGQEQGNAIARVLFGDVNPSGKLPITYPRSETAVPRCLRNPWATEADPDVSYCEGIGVGYRGYELHGIQPLFAFGHGLSYTSFRYAGLSTGPTWRPGRPLRVSLTLANPGRRTGAEVVQIYAGRLPTAVRTPPKQLAGFAKVTLRPGQRTRVTVPLDIRSLSYWDSRTNRWVTPAGPVPIYAGSSSQDLRLVATLRIGQTTNPG